MKLLGAIFRRAVGLRREYSFDEIRSYLASGDLESAGRGLEHIESKVDGKSGLFFALNAELKFRLGDDAAAGAMAKEALLKDPGLADAHYALALVKYEAQEYETALRHAKYAVIASPLSPRFEAQLGLTQMGLGNYAEASEALRKAIQLNPSDKYTWNNFGIASLALAKHFEARNAFRRALDIDAGFEGAAKNFQQLLDEWPESRTAHPESEFPLGENGERAWAVDWAAFDRLWFKGQLAEAYALGERLRDLYPTDTDLTCRLARRYCAGGEPDSALDMLKSAIEDEPASAELLLELARVYLILERPHDAEEHTRKAVMLQPENATARSVLAMALHATARYAEAADEARSSMALQSDRSIALQLVASLVMSGQYAEALTIFDRLRDEGVPVMQLQQAGLSAALCNTRRFEEALAAVDACVEVLPRHAIFRIQQAHLCLLLGRFAEGWDAYAFRALKQERNFRMLPLPLWAGGSLEGRQIVVMAEQGLGDQIMFASCLADLLALNPKRVVIEAHKRVVATLARSFPEATWVSSSQNQDLSWLRDHPESDCFVPMGDLPGVFRRTNEAFPRKPYLRADAERVLFWRGRLAAAASGSTCVGFSWRGGTSGTRQSERSLAAIDLARGLDHAAVHFVVLQYGDVAHEVAALQAAGFSVSYWPEAIGDLDEFAALVSALDGVVSVCNTTVHYAGAVGQRTLVLAPYVPEWRYGAHFSMMPWYSNVEVFRQAEIGSWAESLDKIADRLLLWSDKKVGIDQL
jgi:tetratricopeptide (TPR) repeat protein